MIMTTNEYPINQVFLSYMFLGSGIGSLLTVSGIAILYFNDFLNIGEAILFILFYDLIDIVIGIIPSTLTGLVVIWQKIYKNTFKEYVYFTFLGFLISFMFYAVVIFLFFGEKNYLDGLKFSLVLGGV